MGLSLIQLENSLRKHLGVDSMELDNTSADQLLNRSAWEIFDIYDFKDKEAESTITTVAGTTSYTVPADLDALQGIAIKDINSLDWDAISKNEILEFEENLSDRVDSRAKPTTYLRRSNEIRLYPTPDNAYSIKVKYWKTLADLATGGPTIPESWHEIILYGAIWRGFAEFGDYNRSQAASQMQAKLINPKKTVEQKEKFDTRTAGLDIMRRPYR